MLKILAKKKNFWNVTFLDKLTGKLFTLGDEKIVVALSICLLRGTERRGATLLFLVNCLNFFTSGLIGLGLRGCSWDVGHCAKSFYKHGMLLARNQQDFLYYSSRIEGQNHPQCGVIVNICGIITIRIDMTISKKKK